MLHRDPGHMTILDKIVEQTKEDLKKRKREISVRSLESMQEYERSRRGFRKVLSENGLSIIAEIKKASPSKGLIREDFDHLVIAESYIEGGAAALSVLTDKPFFKGDLKYLEEISMKFDIPLLRKDFIVDPYQVMEARAFGADAVLVIASITSEKQMDELLHAAEESGLDALVECYSEDEVKKMNWSSVNLFGVNNRDLRTFEVDLHRGVSLLQLSPEGTVCVSESGLSTPADLKYLMDHNIDAALIGEHFMRQPDPGSELNDMLKELIMLEKDEAEQRVEK
jgi:indole-3-glycerol phosphate synthase